MLLLGICLRVSNHFSLSEQFSDGCFDICPLIAELLSISWEMRCGGTSINIYLICTKNAKCSICWFTSKYASSTLLAQVLCCSFIVFRGLNFKCTCIKFSKTLLDYIIPIFLIHSIVIFEHFSGKTKFIHF